MRQDSPSLCVRARWKFGARGHVRAFENAYMPPLYYLRLPPLSRFPHSFSHAGLAAAPLTRIGNFLLGAPCGIAWVVNDGAAFVLDTGGPYVAGTAAPDDSYHAQRFAHDGANVVFEWGRVGDNVVGQQLSSDQTNRPGFEFVERVARLDIDIHDDARWGHRNRAVRQRAGSVDVANLSAAENPPLHRKSPLPSLPGSPVRFAAAWAGQAFPVF